MDQVAEHDRLMGELMTQLAQQRDYLSVLGPLSGDRSGILSVAVRGCSDLTEMARILSDSYGVMCRTGHHCAQPYVSQFGLGQVLRMSAHVYTSEDDITAAFQALDEVYPIVAR
jgi:cysteine desulfurase/selenocysteine lyase